MKQNILDRAIGWVAPAAGVRRIRQRAAIDILRRSYDGASRDRLKHSWRAHGTSADAEIGAAGGLLRDRMRDLVRNNPHAANALSVLVTHAVGSGIVPRTKDKKVNALFAEWAKKCDADGHMDFYGMQALAVREMLEAGDGLVRRRRRMPKDGLPVPLQLQILETDQIDTTKSGDRIIQGIEIDALGKPSAYWLYPQHPGNTQVWNSTSIVSRSIPREEIAHAFEKQRVQLRGVPWGSPVISSLYDLATYENAEIVRKKLEACLVGVVTGGGEDDMVGMPLEEGELPGVYNADGEIVEKFGAGMLYHARGGKDIKFTQPAITPNYDAYKTSMLHTIAAGFRVPHALLSGRLDKVNYSSTKVGLETYKRTIDALQWQVIIPMLLEPIWDWFCEAAYFAGKINKRHIPVEWSPPKFPSADEAKDISATVAAMRAGLIDPMDAITERGKTPDEVLAGFAEWHKKIDAAGMVFDSDPRKMSQAGQTQQQEADPPDEETEE